MTSVEFQINAQTGLLAPAAQCPSPNCDERPAGAEVDLIVIHCISLPPGEYGGSHIDAFFCNRLAPEAHAYFREIQDLKVSAHVLIRRDGSVTQFVSFNQRAWHAGESYHSGRERCNDFSVGIELEGTDTSPFESAQYAALRSLITALRTSYPSLMQADVVGHSDIAPGRKTDPGRCFDWAAITR